MNVQPIKTSVFHEKQDLIAFITKHVPKLKNDSVLVVTSKIVALAEGRTAPLGSTKDKEKLIRSESEQGVKTKYTWLTVARGMLMASAGVDESNADGEYVLLPKDSYRSAAELRKKLKQHYRTRNLGVLIVDSRTFPLRAGAAGMAVGYAGFKGVRDYRGTPDIFGRVLQMSRANIADGLASAGVLVMGEGKERQPLAVIENAPVEFAERVSKKELQIPLDDDMYHPFLKKSFGKSRRTKGKRK